jgi:hypothetical protein
MQNTTHSIAGTGTWSRFSERFLKLFHAYAGWLVSITWGRFLFLALVLLISMGIIHDQPPLNWSSRSTYKGRMQAEVKAAQATETAEAESLKRQVVEARMAAMQAQVEPHFLFNTLASIDHLIETDPARQPDAEEPDRAAARQHAHHARSQQPGSGQHRATWGASWR